MSSLLVPGSDHIPNTRLTSEALDRRRPIYQDVLNAPAHQVAAIIGGTLYTRPQPAPLHTIAASYLGDELTSPPGKGLLRSFTEELADLSP